METPISAVLFVDGTPCLELTAQELIYPVTLELEGQEYPVAFHMRPYAAPDLKQVLTALAARFKRIGGASMEILPGNRESCKTFFDRYFIRISGGEAATVDEQKAWLDAYDFIKADVVLNGMTLEAVQNEDSEEKTLKFAISSARNKSITLKQKLLAEEGAGPVTINLVHLFQPILATHYARFERASQESELNTRKNEWKTTEDYDVLERLYDELIDSVSGALVKGKPCTVDNRGDWIRLIPFRQKAVALDEAFRRVKIKNA
jgi:hypothetical protein